MTDLVPINHSKLPDILARRFLQIDALCPFLPDAKLAKLMEKAGIWPPSGKWKADEISAIRKGFTSPGLYEDSVLQPELRHKLVQQATRDKKLMATVLDMMNQLPKSYDTLMYVAMQKVFFALYGDFPLPDKIGGEQIAMVISQSLNVLPFQLSWFLEKSPRRQALILSVMIQVTYFKKTGGKRIFRMSPIHHHFEMGGWSETKVVAVFSIATCLLCLLALVHII